MRVGGLFSVLWNCWLGGRKGIQPVKTEWWHAGMVICLIVWREVQTCIRPSWCHFHSLSLASVKSGLVLPFWYWLTRVVLEKGPLNVCSLCVYYRRERVGVYCENWRLPGPDSDKFHGLAWSFGRRKWSVIRLLSVKYVIFWSCTNILYGDDCAS